VPRIESSRLNDSSLCYEAENSEALGFGFRCGFLGLLHMEIVQERLEREFDLDLLATAPSVRYRVTTKTGEVPDVDTPTKFPPAGISIRLKNPLFGPKSSPRTNIWAAS
jgi:GTP-binding protein LepA